MKISSYRPKERFSDRVADYVRYRPGYPVEVITTLMEQYGLNENSTVADIGCGTGIFTARLVEAGCKVLAIEPNAEMLEGAKEYLAGAERCSFIQAPAEATGLEDGAVDLITVAQAFHWFEVEPVVAEFKRILKPGGAVALLWNNRCHERSGFSQRYDELLVKYAPDYTTLVARNQSREQLDQAFKGWEGEEYTFYNFQEFDPESLKGRVRSCSYCPPESDPTFTLLMEGLEEAFSQHESGGRVKLEYDCNIYCYRKI